MRGEHEAVTKATMICWPTLLTRRPVFPVFRSCCRLIITLSGCAFKMALMPFRSAVGGNRGYGHLPVSSMDYGYRDPYRPGANNGGSMELS